MTVGAISSYSPAIQYQYFGTVISDDRIKYLMQQYGVQSTGDSASDLLALYDAMYPEAGVIAQQEKTSSNQSSSPQNSDYIPWATLMGQIGLRATGDLATDYVAFSDKIKSMQVSATSQQEKASINQLEAEASIVFVQQDQSTKGSSSVSGADIQASLNKLFLLS